MTTEQREFTPSRENEFTYMLDMLGITDSMERRRWETYQQYYHLREARERDRDSRMRLVLWWKSLDGFDTAHFERIGRYLVRQVAVDNLAQLVGAERGGALSAKLDDERRRKIKLFKRIQSAREAAFEFTGRGEYDAKLRELENGNGAHNGHHDKGSRAVRG